MKISKVKNKDLVECCEELWDSLVKNNKSSSDCGLVMVLNAYYYLQYKYKRKIETINDDFYQELIDLAGCRYGGAINLEKVMDKLGISQREISLYEFVYEKKMKFPIGISVDHKKYGSHYICAVDYCTKTKAFRVLNFDKVSTVDGWIFYEDLNMFIRTINSQTTVLFELKLKPIAYI